MPLLSPDSVTHLGGAIVLTRRRRSSAWQARYKMAGRWIRITTKAKDLKEAKAIAEEQYMDARYRAKNNIPVITKRFKDVAKLAIDRMEKSIEAGQGKKTYRDYIQAINRYLIPYFGNQHIDKISQNVMLEFAKWRIEQMGKLPKASTLSNHNAALNRVFDEALLHGYVQKAQIPDLENKGLKAERRPVFSLEEFKAMRRALNEWVKKGREGKSRKMKLLLRSYVLILSYTGMRHGTETENLRWKHIRIIDQNGRHYLEMSVSGKTGKRELIAEKICLIHLLEIGSRRFGALISLDWPEFTKHKDVADFPVFALSDGTVSKNLRQTFKAFLKEYDLLKDPITGEERTLYSLRHTYATFQIVYRGIDLHLLAKQMGTSIAMIEKHYSHLKPRMNAHKLTRDSWSDERPKEGGTDAANVTIGTPI
jgi:integrase